MATKREISASQEWLELHARHLLGGDLCGACSAMAVEDVLIREGGTSRRCTECGWVPTTGAHYNEEA